jgi:hypothetical protein
VPDDAEAHASIDLLTLGSASTIIKILKAPGSDETGGRNVYSRSCFDVATGFNGRGKRHDDGECESCHRNRHELRPLIRNP